MASIYAVLLGFLIGFSPIGTNKIIRILVLALTGG